ncbi:SMI1/KNR4 family protein [Pseudomonas sp. R3-41]
MKISNIKGAVANDAIPSAQLAQLQESFHVKLPSPYVEVLNSVGGFSLQNGVVLYSPSDLVERNKTFEVEKYAPAYLAIGDDSGGRSIMLPLAGEGVYLVDQGSMDPDEFKRIGISLTSWIAGGCMI